MRVSRSATILYYCETISLEKRGTAEGNLNFRGYLDWIDRVEDRSLRENTHKMPEKTSKKENMDIYKLLSEASERKKKEKRAELLRSVDVKEFFEDGSIKIDMKTCKGVECKLCIEVCPTNALYWKTGEVLVTEELCVYCTSCVLSCMVDDCIEVTRKRPNGKTETFSKPQEVFILLDNINTRDRVKAIKMLFPDEEAYLKRYGKHFYQFKKEECARAL